MTVIKDPVFTEESVLTKKKTFAANVVRSGPRTLLELSFDPNDVWGVRKRHYLGGTINGHEVRGVVEGEVPPFFFSLGAAWLRDNYIDIESPVEVTLSPEEPLPETVDDDIASALESEPEAKAFFEGLAPFYRKNFVRWIESARRPETRKVRVAEMMDSLKAGKRDR